MSFYLYNSQELLLELITPEIAELVGMRARKYVVDGFRQTPSNYLIAVSWCSGMRVLRRPAIRVRNFIFTRGNEVVSGQVLIKYVLLTVGLCITTLVLEI